MVIPRRHWPPAAPTPTETGIVRVNRFRAGYAAIVVVLLFNVPLPGEHVLAGGVTALYVSNNFVGGRWAGDCVHRANCRLRTDDMVAVGEDGSQTGWWVALVNGHRMAMVFQHGRMQEPFRLTFPRVPLRKAAVPRAAAMMTRRTAAVARFPVRVISVMVVVTRGARSTGNADAFGRKETLLVRWMAFTVQIGHTSTVRYATEAARLRWTLAWCSAGREENWVGLWVLIKPVGGRRREMEKNERNCYWIAKFESTLNRLLGEIPTLPTLKTVTMRYDLCNLWHLKLLISIVLFIILLIYDNKNCAAGNASLFKIFAGSLSLLVILWKHGEGAK